MARVTYAHEAERLASEINKRLIQQGAKTFCLLRSDEHYDRQRYWLSFTRMTDGTLEHTTSVFAANPKEACKYLKGFLDATCLKGYLD